MQFLPALGGGKGWEEQEASALLSKKGVGREGSIESQQKFDFFCYDITPKKNDTNEEVALDAYIFQHKVIALISCGSESSKY